MLRQSVSSVHWSQTHSWHTVSSLLYKVKKQLGNHKVHVGIFNSNLQHIFQVLDRIDEKDSSTLGGHWLSCQCKRYGTLWLACMGNHCGFAQFLPPWQCSHWDANHWQCFSCTTCRHWLCLLTFLWWSSWFLQDAFGLKRVWTEDVHQIWYNLHGTTLLTLRLRP